ncbi:aminoglycoside phosphotransferase family protein [Streptomyces sp. Ag109_O5-10]|uniref:aminoglycoside phosphotransferase family protein n=1 Tax=Streptomyces sp. Ag109_O5-10 TaxID=1855349 RepID=UPI00089B0A68|nr:aminoglycoside phosphotransferase family protein [Streptomyces sp. Ag109_O5-10]SEE95279.1 Predicted kinase, aminoglycoside phosphotransferase (APT) family [Streptomyces sp. Ag109_O5-10]
MSSGERAKPGAGHALYQHFVGLAMRHGKAHSGHHNRNYVLPLAGSVAQLLGRESGTSVTVRMRRADALPVVIRTWQNEAEILRAVRTVLPNVPQCLFEGNGFAIHSYVEGVPLSSVCGNGKPVDILVIEEIAQILAHMTQVRRAALPGLPASWPSNGQDSQGFLQTLAHCADQQIRRANLSVFGGLFAALGIPEDALTRFAERVPVMTRRPYSLLHADLHRDNLIVTYGGRPPLICVDWELATYGDPLHDLATHLVRMRYPGDQWSEVIEAWVRAMEWTRPGAVNGVHKDLRHYVAFEQAQSVYPDVMRAAASLDESFDQKGLDEATSAVHNALETAQVPLRLRQLPSAAEIERVLFRWRISRGEAHKGLFSSFVSVSWTPDKRFPEHPDFPYAAVQGALHAEGAAPAGRVFKGTGHLNSVVRVPGIEFPVVVRRKVKKVFRRERSFLSEHAVLRAIESSGVPVAAPRVLALGESYPGKYRKDSFAIHTYEGPFDIDRPPNHPVHGLLPHEADRLVDQLSALKGVDYTGLDPAAGETSYNFYNYLSEQLVLLVRHLPKESQQLARQLGLPDAERLRQILGRHQVADRSPMLLHGDLNPWNLVRRDDAMALTIIDWEMAVVGDPLYDLVRHMHLTPTRPEIRDRMFRRWERLLPEAYTRAWQQDWRVYRWIEIVRSAYVDLDRLVTGASLDAPNVRRAVDSYAMTLAAAIASLGLPVRAAASPHLARALT